MGQTSLLTGGLWLSRRGVRFEMLSRRCGLRRLSQLLRRGICPPVEVDPVAAHLSQPISLYGVYVTTLSSAKISAPAE